MAHHLLDTGTLFRIELGLALLAVLVALFWPARWCVPLGGIESALVRLAGATWTQALVVLGLAISLRLALLPVLGPPVPFVADEFSLLLQAQTFAEGRLVNPTHPLYPFFESLYVNQHPFYASMYFPGRSAPLLLGIVLAGHPWAGVVFSMALLAVAMVWMLRAWVSAPLALAGGLLVVLRYGVLSGWINSYYGGGLIALGGVLVLGAYPRLMHASSRWRDGIALAMGLLILLVSRPFEGFFFAFPFLAMGSWKIVALVVDRKPDEHGSQPRNLSEAIRMAAPTLLLTGAGIALLLANNLATTGSLLHDPYTLNRDTYAYVPPFLFGEMSEPTYRVPAAFTQYYRNEAPSFEHVGSPSVLLGLTMDKLKRLVNFYLGAIFLIPFMIGLVRAIRTPILLVSSALLMASFLVNTWHWSQYVAPGFGLFWIFIMSGFAGLRNWQFRGRSSGLVLSRLFAGLTALVLALPVTALLAGNRNFTRETFIRPCCNLVDETERSQLIKALLATPGRDLVVYHPTPGMTPYVSFVSNEPDIDSSEIVFAHDLGPRSQRLLNYYPDRVVWLVDETGMQHARKLAPGQRLLGLEN